MQYEQTDEGLGSTYRSLPQKEWDRRFMEVAKLTSSWSKDPSTKVGAVVVNRKNVILSSGWNGFPRGIKDDSDRLNIREIKYKYIVHAEMNAIYNATYNGVSLDNSTLYVYGLPICSECTKGVIQVGIKRVVLPSLKDVPEKWLLQWQNTSQPMYEEAGVEITFMDFESA
jgi:dCMP deaminase